MCLRKYQVSSSVVCTAAQTGASPELPFVLVRFVRAAAARMRLLHADPTSLVPLPGQILHTIGTNSAHKSGPPPKNCAIGHRHRHKDGGHAPAKLKRSWNLNSARRHRRREGRHIFELSYSIFHFYLVGNLSDQHERRQWRVPAMPICSGRSTSSAPPPSRPTPPRTPRCPSSSPPV